MSAFLVEETHIRALVFAALGAYSENPHTSREPLSWRHDESWRTLSYLTSDQRTRQERSPEQVGRMLWAECAASVNYRYRHHGEPPASPVYCHRERVPQLSVVDALKLVQGYCYQSCEHPGWLESEARAFCEALQHYLIQRLPGYFDAPWTLGHAA